MCNDELHFHELLDAKLQKHSSTWFYCMRHLLQWYGLQGAQELLLSITTVCATISLLYGAMMSVCAFALLQEVTRSLAAAGMLSQAFKLIASTVPHTSDTHALTAPQQ
jgi:hypothetical protein